MNKFKLLFLVFAILYQTSVYSKTSEDLNFNPKYLSGYLSALISYGNQNNEESVKHFNSTKFLIDKHSGYLKDYIFALVLNGEIKKAIAQIKRNKNSNFFESELLLIIDNFKKKNFKKNLILLDNLKKFTNENSFNFIIYEVLKSYNNLFLNKTISESNKNLGKLTNINKAMQYCYLNSSETSLKFKDLTNFESGDYSRYIFFYLNYLINNNYIIEAKKISNKINEIGSNLLITQAKNWIQNSEYNKINEFFSCQNEADLVSEFFFLISNFYASEDDFEKSNFFVYISNYLNPKFYFNFTHLVENFFDNEKYELAKILLKSFNEDDEVYYWYRLKKLSQIISIKESPEKSLEFMEKNFKNYKDPSLKILLDMGNIYKRNKEFEKSIQLYSEVLSKLDQSSNVYAEVLYSRGGSYERIDDHINSDKDLIESLNVRPNDPYVMNYLAYGWLERDYKIDEAIEMLDKAYKQKKNDPFIIDSVGRGYYLIKDFDNAERFLQRAIKLMPKDPIVNDHYGDVLWKLDRKLQAKYYWESALNSIESDDKLKKIIFNKLLKGL